MKKKKNVRLLSFFWLFLILLIGQSSKNIHAMQGSYAWRPFPSEFLSYVYLDAVQEVKKYLQAGADVNERDPKDNQTALHIAVGENNNIKTLKILLATEGVKIDVRADDGWTPFMLAAFLGHGEAMRLLLAKGANINARDNEGSTILHILAEQSNKLLCVFFCEHKHTIPFLLKAGADLSIKNREGKTPYDYATEEIQAIMKPFIKEADEKALADEEPSCSICLEEDQGKSIRLGCNHSFHKECIEQWLVKSKTCPICRSKVS